MKRVEARKNLLKQVRKTNGIRKTAKLWRISSKYEWKTTLTETKGVGL